MKKLVKVVASCLLAACLVSVVVVDSYGATNKIIQPTYGDDVNDENTKN